MVYVFYQLCSHASSREYVRDHTEVILAQTYSDLKKSLAKKFKLNPCQATPYLLDLLHDRNPEVQRVCDATLQLIGEVNQEQ